MCGITGFVDFNFSLKEEHLQGMLRPLHHRGPDDAGQKLIRSTNAQIGLAMKRLAIVELSPLGHQPMSFENLTIVFNGEIYNFRELRKELEALGYSFNSASDTEVILKAYHAWGISCVHKFIGMFAIAIYDNILDELILIRDRAGVKPLYIYNNRGIILFASELKSFHACPLFARAIDLNALGQYFKFGYIPAPYSIFQHTEKVKPGHWLKINLKSRAIEDQCYWDAQSFYSQEKLNVSFEEALDTTERLLISACNYRMVADVPVGVFLSGGYDSSTVTALLQKYSGQRIRTFSIGFHEDQFNEAQYAKKVADYLGTDHHEHYCSVNEAKEIIPDLPKIYDEPFGDSSAIPTTLVSKIAVKDVKVALSADAGDEIFAGYGNYAYFLKQFNKLHSLPRPLRKIFAGTIPQLSPAVRAMSRFFYNLDTRMTKLPELLNTDSPVRFNEVINQYFTDAEIKSLVHGKVEDLRKTAFKDDVNLKTNDFMNLQLAIGYKTFLVDDILTKVDRATMSASLEGREPLLDHRIIEYVSRLPSDFKYHQGITKHLLKEVAHRYIPKPLVDRPKMGFSIPVEKWLKSDLRYLLDTHLSKESINRVGILNYEIVEKIRKDFSEGHRFNFSKIWFLLMFQMWAAQWLEGRTK